MQFNLRKTLHATPIRHREEISSLLQTAVAANADCHVPCAGPPSNRSELARLNLKPALRPMGVPATTTGYTLVESNNGPVRLEDEACPWRCMLCLCCILILVGGGVGLAYGLRPSSSSSSSATVAAGPPPPPYVATPLWGRLSTRKVPSKRSARRSPPPPPPPPQRKSPPPPSAALPDSDLVLDILEHGTGE